MLNKILFKKIKFPLSLRGAKQRSNLKGFSLIELMVAVVILVMAIFGIFLAFSTSFQGMADARDRTVATNYAREAMEDIKNMDFSKIETTTFPITGTKFTKVVIVQSSINLKTITTQVYWKDRNGNAKMVETNMSVHFIETTAGTAIKIMLYAEPYNISTTGTSTITAVVKDVKGNTVINWNKDINFSFTGSGSFSFSTTITNITVTHDNFDNGKAIVYFYSSEYPGDVTITADSVGLTSDSVTIKITDPEVPVKINLTAEPMFMTTESNSTITATIVNALGDPVALLEEQVDITFNVSVLGILPPETTRTTYGGETTITLTSNGTSGTITVTATSVYDDEYNNLIPGVVNVYTGGSIHLSASPTNVANGEKSIITVIVKDLSGVSIKYIGTIDLSVIPYGDPAGSGDLPPEDVVFNGDTYLERVTFTASSEGKVEITAIDTSVSAILESANIILTIDPTLVPHHIEVSAYPSSIEAGGTDTSTITARVKTEDNITITSYNIPLNFITDNSTFVESGTGEISLSIDEAGKAAVELYSSDTAGTATITVSSDTLLPGSVEVEFYTEAHHIKLVATPPNIQVGNVKFSVKAIMEDVNNAQISNYNESVTFLIVNTDIIKYQTSDTGSLTTTFSGGEVIIIMRSKDKAGIATINADSGGILGTLNIPVGITLSLVENSISYLDNTVSFNIDVQGAELLLEEMRVSWLSSDSEVLNKIEINGSEVYSNLDGVSSDTLVDINYNTILSTVISNVIIMYFDTVMSGKSFTVILNPNSGDYQVEFPVLP